MQEKVEEYPLGSKLRSRLDLWISALAEVDLEGSNIHPALHDMVY